MFCWEDGSPPWLWSCFDVKRCFVLLDYGVRVWGGSPPLNIWPPFPLLKWTRSGFVWMYHFFCLPECSSKTLESGLKVPLWIYGLFLLLLRWTRSGFVECIIYFVFLDVGVKRRESPVECLASSFHCWGEREVVLFEWIISFVFLNVWVKYWSWGWKPPLDYLASSFHCSGEPEDLSCLNVTLFCPPRCWCLTLELGLEVPFEYLASSSCCSGEPEVPPGVTHLASVTPLALGWKHLYW